MPGYRHAVLGGTFDHLHVGHLALLNRAFEVGRRVSIGLTTDRYLARHPKPYGRRLQTYASRRSALRRWLRRCYPSRTWRIVPLENRFGRSVEEGVDVLVVSSDTAAGGEAVNRERRRLGRSSVPLVVVPVALADDLEPVSSRRVRSGAIDAQGRRRAPLTVGAAVEVPGDRKPLARAFRRAFARVRPVWVETPRRSARRAGPSERARRLARAAGKGRGLGIGVARAPEDRRYVVERAGRLELTPRAVRAGRPAELEREVLGLLRPDLERKAFGPPRVFRRRWRPTSE